MRELDKPAVGRRIREIRLAAGFRQWELAKLLGTTQSAIHKYEHGVIPEPKRLIELARIGDTSVEWLLTGRHWENGSAERRRLTPNLLETARLLREVEDHDAVGEALGIVRDALDAARHEGPAAEAARLLEVAARIRSAVLRRVLGDAAARLQSSPLLADEDRETRKR